MTIINSPKVTKKWLTEYAEQALAPFMDVQQHRICGPLVSADPNADDEHNPQIQNKRVFQVEKEK